MYLDVKSVYLDVKSQYFGVAGGGGGAGAGAGGAGGAGGAAGAGAGAAAGGGGGAGGRTLPEPGEGHRLQMAVVVVSALNGRNSIGSELQQQKPGRGQGRRESRMSQWRSLLTAKPYFNAQVASSERALRKRRLLMSR